MNKKESFYKITMIVIITVMITLLLSSIFMYNYFKMNPNTRYIFVGKDKNINLQESVTGIREIIDEYYLGDIPEDNEMVEGAIKGYVASLNDEYTEYMTSAEWKEYKEQVLGNYTGLGVYFAEDELGMKISGVIKDSPAEKNGLKVNDIVVKVDNLVCTKDNMDEVTAYIKSGEVGSKFNIEFMRGEEKINKEIVRENIRVVQVESELLKSNVGYIKLSTFDEGCADDFKKNYNELLKNGAKSIILDLRNNTGGVLEEAINISDLLLEKDSKIIITHDKENGEKIYTDKKAKEFNLPMAVLINDYSASASEILVAALKDNNRAKILGTKTFGKGVLQEVLTLSNGAALKITTNEFLTPNGNKIHKVGIEPDIEVKLPEKYTNIMYVPKGEDNQLEKAIELLTI